MYKPVSYQRPKTTFSENFGKFMSAAEDKQKLKKNKSDISCQIDIIFPHFHMHHRKTVNRNMLA